MKGIVRAHQDTVLQDLGGGCSRRVLSWNDQMMAVEVTKEDEDFMTKSDNGSLIIGRMTVSIIKGRNTPRCKTHIIPRFSRMSWLEKVEEEMLGCGNGKEIKMKEPSTGRKQETKTEEKEPDILAGE